MQAARTQVLQLQAELEDLRASASAPPVATHVHRSNAEVCLSPRFERLCHRALNAAPNGEGEER
eukprot:scaffold243164_cov13-Tisochrysis_lutea.AAC.1